MKSKVYMSGQKGRLTPQIKREFTRRAAIEPVIGHLKEHHRMGRNYLAHLSGDAALTAAYSFALAPDRKSQNGDGGPKHREVSNAQSRSG